MRFSRGLAQRPVKQLPQTLGAFREHLIGVPVRELHCSSYLRNVLDRNPFVKQIAHRVDEYHPGLTPAQGLAKFLGNKPQVEAVLERMSLYAAESLEYIKQPLHRMKLVRSVEKNLPLYYLALFSRNETAYKFWGEVLKYSTDQSSLWD